MTTFLSDIVLAGANDIQFKNTSGANTGKIESDGNDLVLSNAVGDILLGDGASDVYIGDGTNSVDIRFEVSGAISAESGAQLTLGGAGGTLALGGAISLADYVSAISATGVNTVDVGTSAKPFKNIYAAHHVGGSSINYATSRGWVEDDAPLSSTQVGEFGGNFTLNGTTAENAVVWGDDPFNNKALLWKCILNTSASDGDGGWNKNIVIPANNNIGYLSYVYFKTDFTPDNANDGTVYLGGGQTTGQTLNLDGSNNTNPYSTSSALNATNNGGALTANRWYIMVGIYQAYNNSTTDNDTVAGVYDVETGEKVATGGEFKMGNNTTGQVHRAYMYYDASTDANENVYFWNPGFHAIDGSEPKIQDLVKRQVYLDDNVKAAFGTGNDLEIYHDGSNSYIKEGGTGDLRIWADSPNIGTASGNKIFYGNNGAAELYFTGGNKKLETVTGGVEITGELQADSLDIDGNAAIDGLTTLTSSVHPLILDRTGGSTALIQFKINGTSEGYLGATSTKSLVVYDESPAEKFSVSNAGAVTAVGSVTATGLDINGNADISGDLTGVDTLTATTFSGDLNGTINTATTAATQSASNNSTKVATTAYVDAQVATVVDSAPGTLDTLNELAAALGDDANFSTTVTNSIAAKLPLAGGTMSGPVKFSSTTYGAFDSENFFRIKLQDVGGVMNDVGIGQTASNNLGFNTTAGGTFTFNDGTNGNVLTISDGQATFDGEVEAASLDINGNADISGDLTGLDNVTSTNFIIGGHTIDDVDLAGEFVDSSNHLITSAAANDRFAQINANTTGSSASCTGNAATATKLAATKTIAGVAFDGSANIALSNQYIANGAGYTGDQSQSDINALAITTVGIIGSGEWRGTAIHSTYLDADTAHLTTNQTFTGVKTFNEAINKKSLNFIFVANKFVSSTANETYFSLGDTDRDQPKGTEDGVGVVAVMPCNGILRQVEMNASSNLSSKSWTYKLYRIPSGTAYTSEILVATVTASAGPAGNTNATISLVTDPEDGTNDITYESGYNATTMFTKGDRALFSLQSNSDAAGTPKINTTFCFELDESTI